MSLSLLKLLYADATVAGAARNIPKLTLKLGNILSNLYSAKAFNSFNAPYCFLSKLALWTIVMWLISCTKSSLQLICLEYFSASLAALRFNSLLIVFSRSKQSWRYQKSVFCTETNCKLSNNIIQYYIKYVLSKVGFFSGFICLVHFIHIFIRCILILESCSFPVELRSLTNFTSIFRLDATSLASFQIAFQLSQRATGYASKFSIFATSICKVALLAWMTLLQKSIRIILL